MPSFDCTNLIKNKQGEAYCHEYDNYLNFFHLLACSDIPYECSNVPSCWAPFVLYLGHKVGSTRMYTELGNEWDCNTSNWWGFYVEAKDKRRVVEIASNCRPELVHALYCADTEWPCLLKEKHQHQKSFVVTCNASFFRPEVQAYRKKLQEFVPTKSRAVLVPCAAAKPYPAPLHREVLRRIDRANWHVITATGVLGLVPEELWDEMPHYDSGLPNLTRCSDTVRWYFTKWRYSHLVIYSDFYAPAIFEGLRPVRPTPKENYVLGAHFRDRYENLMLDENLQALESAIAEMERD